jgi:hypothetical protein
MRSYQLQWKSLGLGSDIDTFEDLEEVANDQNSPSFIDSDEGVEVLRFMEING